MKYNFLILFCIFLIQSTQAQISVAFSGGLNSTELYTPSSSNIEYSQLQNFYVGIAPVIGGKKTRLRLGLQGAYKGTKANGSDSFRGFYADFVPELEFRPIKLIGFAVGGNIGLNLNSETNLGNGWQEGVQGLFNETDYGLRAAARLYLWRLSFEVAYNHGLGAAVEYTLTDANGNDIGTEEAYFRGFQLGVAYRFGKN